METTTLQQRIEERAAKKLIKDLYDAYQKELDIQRMINNEGLFSAQLRVREFYGRSYDRFEVGNEFTKKVFEHLLPRYIINATDEILKKIDEIDWLSKQNANEE